MAIKNGKVYSSKASAYQVLVRPKLDVWNRDGTVLLETRAPLTAEFAYHGGEFVFDNHLTGAKDVGADIRGHFFDSAQQAEEKGWTQEEHDTVIQVLDRQCKITPEYVWEVVVEAAPLPWDTYDSTPAGKIVELAVAIGRVPAALAYEAENKARKTVLEGLGAASPQPEESVEELTAA